MAVVAYRGTVQTNFLATALDSTTVFGTFAEQQLHNNFWGLKVFGGYLIVKFPFPQFWWRLVTQLGLNLEINSKAMLLCFPLDGERAACLVSW